MAIDLQQPIDLARFSTWVKQEYLEKIIGETYLSLLQCVHMGLLEKILHVRMRSFQNFIPCLKQDDFIGR